MAEWSLVVYTHKLSSTFIVVRRSLIQDQKVNIIDEIGYTNPNMGKTKSSYRDIHSSLTLLRSSSEGEVEK